MSYECSVAFISDHNEKSEHLAIKLNLPVVSEMSDEYSLYLSYKSGQLYLSGIIDHTLLSTSVDFQSDKLVFRQKQLSLKTEPLLRAIGCNRQEMLDVIDATAGMGRDSFLMANFNCQVRMLEQSPIVAVLLEDGLKRAFKAPDLSDPVSKMSLIKQSSTKYLQALHTKPDVVYLDPMFPPRTKSSKVKKEMQLLHALLGYNDEIENARLLSAALNNVRKRVVVKRPKVAPNLADKKPSHTINSKGMRFDVYVV